jgi:hypothetical protein
MAEIIQFVPKSELERATLIRNARAIYDSIFPQAAPASEQRHKAAARHMAGANNARPGDGILPS